MTHLLVLATGPLATCQDLGRPGYAHLGVPRSGAADRAAIRLANRLVGNRESDAGIEVTLGGLRIRAESSMLVAVTGALAVVTVDGRPAGRGAMIEVPAGAELEVRVPAPDAHPDVRRGCRQYVAVRGGLDVPPVLGSRSTDTLSDLGPRPLAPGDRLPVGTVRGDWPTVSAAPLRDLPRGVVELIAHGGPRPDLLDDASSLTEGVWEVGAASNRVGLRLDRGAGSADRLTPHRADAGELASEGIAHGSIQIPPSGRPVILLADHPVTGGYPVAAVLDAASLDVAGQLMAADRLRIRLR